ncbi:Uncharacterised protein [Klebsiella variicola]|nr:Uncharacterised protein [Klebsiella variicola]SLW88918.1 Uncharacterised protein [Klebsiella variicola]SLY50952.1 Uncharacterised protein [Klebsiella variicola]SMA31191.1 Uncharacterised protein [Klebsiella variicola]SMA34607.1 Uncharacterised protein [Klebsiella variicola]
MLAVRRLYLGCAGVYTYLKYFIGMQINLSDKVHMLFSKYFRVLCLDLLRCCLRYGLLRSSPTTDFTSFHVDSIISGR